MAWPVGMEMGRTNWEMGTVLQAGYQADGKISLAARRAWESGGGQNQALALKVDDLNSD